MMIKKFELLHLFSGYNTITAQAHKMNVNVTSLDIQNYKGCLQSTIISDFLEWKHQVHNPKSFDFVLIGFPCTTFSKAAGNFHFKNNIPITESAKKSILMIDKLIEVLEYFECDFMIENPTSALFSNYYFKSKMKIVNYNLIRLHQYNFGHSCFKQTDLLTSKNNLVLSNPVHRVNKKNVSKNMDNLTLKQRQSYPVLFCEFILNFILC